MKAKIFLLALSTTIFTETAHADSCSEPEIEAGTCIPVSGARYQYDNQFNNDGGWAWEYEYSFGSSEGGVGGGGAAPTFEPIDQCSLAEAAVNKAIDEIDQIQPPVRVIGEVHFGEEGALTTEETQDLISRVQSNTGGGCLAIEQPPSEANQLQVVLTVQIANQLGMRPIFIDTAVVGMTWEQSQSTEGFNIRDLAMAQNIRANLSSCGTIVALLGGYHATHKMDALGGYDTSQRVNVTDHLGDLAKAVDVSEAGLACK